MVFLLAGFDTTATTLTNACYLLAKNPEVQDRLAEAIASKSDEFVSRNDFFLIYQDLSDLSKLCLKKGQCKS